MQIQCYKFVICPQEESILMACSVKYTKFMHCTYVNLFEILDSFVECSDATRSLSTQHSILEITQLNAWWNYIFMMHGSSHKKCHVMTTCPQCFRTFCYLLAIIGTCPGHFQLISWSTWKYHVNYLSWIDRGRFLKMLMF